MSTAATRLRYCPNCGHDLDATPAKWWVWRNTDTGHTDATLYDPRTRNPNAPIVLLATAPAGTYKAALALAS